jgi:hypothetical protein
MRIRSLTAAVAATLVTLTAAPANAAVAPSDWTSSGASHTGSDNHRTKVLDLWHVPRKNFDRVVIRLRGGQPDWRTDYGRHFTYEGSGHDIPIRGRAGLRLTLTAVGHRDNGENLYLGPRLARPRSDTLRALAMAGDFEGQMTFVFALEHRAPHRVKHERGPSRLVLDFQHR